MSDRFKDRESWLASLQAEKRERQERFEKMRAEALAAGKEPFDFERLGAKITVKRPGDPRGDDEIRQEWEERYYVMHADLQTLDALIEYYLPLEDWITPI